MAKKPVKYSVVNAFSELAFKGNPAAAVCLLEEEREEKWLQAVATEFNVPVTCYLTTILALSNPSSLFHHHHPPRFNLRWFTHLTEVDICGHATLAAAHTLFSSGLVDGNIIEFMTLSGLLTAKRIMQPINMTASNGHETKDGFCIELDFPAYPIIDSNFVETSEISKALDGASIIDIKRTHIIDDLLVIVKSGEAVTKVEPKLDAIIKFPGRGLIVSGIAPPGSGFDFYSRFFCPKYGVNEDPVCGSAHCGLASYWSKRIGKCDLNAYQASSRGGSLNIHLDEQNQRVLLRGKAVTVMEGCILV